MKEEEIFSKSLILSTEFAEKIPQNAQIVLLPEDDPELLKENIEIAKTQREPGQPVVYVYVEKVAPQISRLVNPRLEIAVT